jgi:flavodoxin
LFKPDRINKDKGDETNMKNIIVYYTFGGSTKKEAERLAADLQAPVLRVMETRNRSFVGAFVPGGLQAMRRKASTIKPLDIRLQDYDRIIIGSPVWAGYPAPAFNAIVELLPKGKEVEVFLCSGGGETPKSDQGTRALIEKKGCTLVSYRDVKTGTMPGKIKE